MQHSCTSQCCSICHESFPLFPIIIFLYCNAFPFTFPSLWTNFVNLQKFFINFITNNNMFYSNIRCYLNKKLCSQHGCSLKKSLHVWFPLQLTDFASTILSTIKNTLLSIKKHARISFLTCFISSQNREYRIKLHFLAITGSNICWFSDLF